MWAMQWTSHMFWIDSFGSSSPADGDVAGVRHEQVDRPVGALGVVDEPLDRRLVADVDLDAGAADLAGDPLGLGAVQVGDDDVTCPGVGGGSGERFADARSTAGDDHDPVVQFHVGERYAARDEPSRSGRPTSTDIDRRRSTTSAPGPLRVERVGPRRTSVASSLWVVGGNHHHGGDDRPSGC